MSNEPSLSKRERQKLRRDQKREAQLAAQARARRNRFLALGLVVLLVVAGIGWFIYGQIAERQALAAAIEEADAQREQLGCTPAVSEAAGGAAQHIAPAQLASRPPDQLYDQLPPSSGPHMPQVVATGVYDVQIDPRLLVHNLEHGAVVSWYDSDAPDEQVAALKEWAQERIDGDYPKLVVAPWDGTFENEANFVTVSWGTRQICEQFGANVWLAYLAAHYGDNSGAPETFAPVAMAGAQGVLDPQGEPLLFPPLGQPGGATEAPTDGAAPTTPTASPRPTG